LRSKWAAAKVRGGRISKLIRNRKATQPPAHFHRNPLGRGQLAAFPRCSLLTSRTIFALPPISVSPASAKMVRDARRCRQSGSDRLEKQPTDPAAAGQKA